MLSKFKQLGKESVIYGVGSAVIGSVTLVLLPLYTRVFTTAEMGVIDLITTITLLATIVLTSGTDTALSYYFFDLQEQGERRKTVTATAFYLFVINLFVAVVIWSAAEPISVKILGGAQYAGYLRVASISLPFSALFTLNLNVLRLQRKAWAYVGLSFAQSFLIIALNLVLILVLHVGIIGVFITNAAAAILALFVGARLVRAFLESSVDLRRLKQLLRYGLPLVIGGVSVWAITYLNRYVLLQFTSLDEVGIYAVGTRLGMAVQLFTHAFRIANAPFQFEVASDQRSREIYSRTLNYFVLFMSAICVPLALFARPVLRILTTEAYLGAYIVVPFVAYAIMADGVGQIVSIGLLLTRRTGLTGILIAVSAVLNILYLYLLVPPLGILGAALSFLLARLTLDVVFLLATQRLYPIPFDLWRVFRILLSGAVVIGVGFAIGPSNFWLESLTAAGLFAVFLVTIPLFSLLNRRELQILFGSLKKLLARAK